MPSADHRVAIPEGDRQYHIGLAPGELADYILLPGDPDRTARIASRFDSIELEHRHREFVSATGTYAGQRVSVVSTGIGTDNVEIVVAEILAITERPTFIRVGSCGALQPGMELATWSSRPAPSGSRPPRRSSSTTATRPSRTTRRSSRSSRRLSRSVTGITSGITATAPGFFGAQGRPIPHLPIRYPDLADEMARQGVLNFEMEASALLVLAGLGKCRAGVVCAVYAKRTTGEFVAGDVKDQAEAAAVETGLESLRILAELDRQKRSAGAEHWRPSLWKTSPTGAR